MRIRRLVQWTITAQKQVGIIGDLQTGVRSGILERRNTQQTRNAIEVDEEVMAWFTCDLRRRGVHRLAGTKH